MRRTMPSRVVLCLLAAYAASPASAQGDANATVCAADDDSAFSPEQRMAACNALIKAARNAPKEVADALVNRGQAAWYADKVNQAFADLDRAIALDPNNARAFRERSNAYRSIGKLDRALADASEAVRLDPRDAKAFDNRGDVFVDKGQYDRAIQDYDEALRLDPKLSLAYRDRGAAYYFNKDYERAIKDYDEAIKLDPRSDRAYSNRGAAYGKLGRNTQAIADESEAIKLDPSEPAYFDNRGLSYAEEGDYDRAVIDYNEAIRISPRANFLTDRGNAYQAKGDLAALSPTTTARSSLTQPSPTPTTTAARPSAARAISVERSPTTRRRYVSIQGSRQPLRTLRPSKLCASGNEMRGEVVAPLAGPAVLALQWFVSHCTLVANAKMTMIQFQQKCVCGFGHFNWEIL